MDEIIKQSEKILSEVNSISSGWKTDFEILESRLKELCYNSKSVERTPQRAKKIHKKLSAVSEIGQANTTENSEQNATLQSIKADGETTISGRPKRVARILAETRLIEPTLNSKMRRPSATNTTLSNTTLSTTMGMAVKLERISNVSQQDAKSNDEIQSEAGPQKRKSKEEEKTIEESANSGKTSDPAKKLDASLVILPTKESGVIALSDDETDKMPPPAVLPKKKKNRKPPAVVEEDSPIMRSTRSKIKKEKLSVEQKSEEVEKLHVEKLPVNIIKKSSENVSSVSEVSKTDSTITTNTSVATKSKGGKKGQKQIKHRPIKVEAFSDDQKTDKEVTETVAAVTENITPLPQEQEPEKEIPEDITTKPSAQQGGDKNVTMESVYEDAVSTAPKTSTVNLVLGETFVAPPSVTVEKPTAIQNEKPLIKEKPVIKPRTLANPADATFVTAKASPIAEQPPAADATYIASTNDLKSPPLHSAEKLRNEIDNMPSPIGSSTVLLPNNATFCLNTTTTVKTTKIPEKIPEYSASSLITEDNSDEEYLPESPSPKPKPKPLNLKKNQKELFNPCVQSPVKKKVEAFEKHAALGMMSPAATRLTRMQTKMNVSKENKNPDGGKANTPLFSNQIKKFYTPSGTSSLPQILIPKQISSSASKISCLPKPTLKPVPSSLSGSSTSSTRSNSQEHNAEDPKKALNKIHQLVEEKRKKREQKERNAAQAREALERERAEKLKKLLAEREEKSRRKAIQAEEKRQLEEINRQLKLQEEKREAQRRLEKQKQLELDAIENARKERALQDELKIQKAKQALILKQQQNEKLLQQQKAKNDKKNKFDFSMLLSDDSTDDEGKISKKRPPPPPWCRPSSRKMLMEEQSYLPTNIIDSFFSVQPMTPDLQKIFPSINPRHLKRNSSVFWKTPPRYSQLPKY